MSAPVPNEVVPEYETDPSATGTGRTAEPPDGVDQDWTEVHPSALRTTEEAP